ncbi:hypothetical protein AC626_07710 [Pseudoalteromonas rubra]|uniref:Uncharacterized protein n=1 Tax=Pseudoalteromonas rubra TaxID=43658 RepID=A0A0L0EU69_9GAMM|nr:hypothetical protein AC626_07710 [Pseudoalteromonas rubra]
MDSLAHKSSQGKANCIEIVRCDNSPLQIFTTEEFVQIHAPIAGFQVRYSILPRPLPQNTDTKKPTLVG